MKTNIEIKNKRCIVAVYDIPVFKQLKSKYRL